MIETKCVMQKQNYETQEAWRKVALRQKHRSLPTSGQAKDRPLHNLRITLPLRTRKSRRARRLALRYNNVNGV